MKSRINRKLMVGLVTALPIAAALACSVIALIPRGEKPEPTGEVTLDQFISRYTKIYNTYMSSENCYDLKDEGKVTGTWFNQEQKTIQQVRWNPLNKEQLILNANMEYCPISVRNEPSSYKNKLSGLEQQSASHKYVINEDGSITCEFMGADGKVIFSESFNVDGYLLLHTEKEYMKVEMQYTAKPTTPRNNDLSQFILKYDVFSKNYENNPYTYCSKDIANKNIVGTVKETRDLKNAPTTTEYNIKGWCYEANRDVIMPVFWNDELLSSPSISRQLNGTKSEQLLFSIWSGQVDSDVSKVEYSISDTEAKIDITDKNGDKVLSQIVDSNLYIKYAYMNVAARNVKQEYSLTYNSAPSFPKAADAATLHGNYIDIGYNINNDSIKGYNGKDDITMRKIKGHLVVENNTRYTLSDVNRIGTITSATFGEFPNQVQLNVIKGDEKIELYKKLIDLGYKPTFNYARLSTNATFLDASNNIVYEERYNTIGLATKIIDTLGITSLAGGKPYYLEINYAQDPTWDINFSYEKFIEASKKLSDKYNSIDKAYVKDDIGSKVKFTCKINGEAADCTDLYFGRNKGYSSEEFGISDYTQWATFVGSGGSMTMNLALSRGLDELCSTYIDGSHVAYGVSRFHIYESNYLVKSHKYIVENDGISCEYYDKSNKLIYCERYNSNGMLTYYCNSIDSGSFELTIDYAQEPTTLKLNAFDPLIIASNKLSKKYLANTNSYAKSDIGTGTGKISGTSSINSGGVSQTISLDDFDYNRSYDKKVALFGSESFQISIEEDFNNLQHFLQQWKTKYIDTSKNYDFIVQQDGGLSCKFWDTDKTIWEGFAYNKNGYLTSFRYIGLDGTIIEVKMNYNDVEPSHPKTADLDAWIAKANEFSNTFKHNPYRYDTTDLGEDAGHINGIIHYADEDHPIVYVGWNIEDNVDAWDAGYNTISLTALPTKEELLRIEVETGSNPIITYTITDDKIACEMKASDGVTYFKIIINKYGYIEYYQWYDFYFQMNYNNVEPTTKKTI